jgi:hypothetical protein
VSFGAIITAVLAAIPAIQKIMEMFQKWLPAKTEGERAVDKYKKAVDKRIELNHKIATAVKEARKGRTDELEKILNGK